MAVGDLNGDSVLDLVVPDAFVSVSVLLGVGNGSFGPPTAIPFDSAGAVTLADFNGDSILDLAVMDQDTAHELVAVMMGIGDGTFESRTAFSTAGGGKRSPPQISALTDARISRSESSRSTAAPS